MRRLLIALIALGLGLGSADAATASAGAASRVTASSDDAVQGLGACIAGGAPADFLLLVDESSSLRSTDPGNARVTSAKYLVKQLQSFGTRTKASVSVQVASFGDTYTRVGAWRSVSSGSTTGTDSALDSLRASTSGFDTDYWTALHGAQTDLAKRADGATGKRCQAIVWFTDGALDYFPRTTPAERQQYGVRKVFDRSVSLTSAAAAKKVRASAQKDLCRAGGVADQARTSGITLLAIGLSTAASKPDFGLMKSIATGSAGGADCGDQAGVTPGAFFPVDDIESLLSAFDSISTPGTAPIEQEADICQATTTACRGGTHSFVLDSSISTVHVLATATVSGLQGLLRAPSGHRFAVPSSGAGTITSKGVTLTYRWVTAKALSVDLREGTGTGAAWTGLWKFAFIDPTASSAKGTSHTNIHLESTIRPTVADVPTLHRGGSASLRFGLVDTDGTSVAPESLLGKVGYTAELIDAAGAGHPVLRTVVKSKIGKPVTMSLADVAVGAATLRLTDQITTASTTDASGNTVAGTELAPTSVDLPLTIAPPVSYPSVQTDVDFGVVDGGDATARLSVEGSGCVWVAGATSIAAAPDGIGTPTVTSDASSRSRCADVRSGDTITVKLAATGSGNGRLNGSIAVRALPADKTGEVLTTPVAIHAEFQRPLDRGVFLLGLIGALLLGFGIPLLLLYGLKWWVSRIPPRPLAASLIDVQVDDSGVRRDGAPFAVLAEDFKGHVGMGRFGTRRFSVEDVVLRARTGLSPIGSARVEVDAGARLAVSDVDGSQVPTHATLPLAVHGHFVVLRAPGTPADRAQILLLLGGDAGGSERERIASEVSRRAPELVAALVAVDPTPAPAESVFAGIGAATASSDVNPWGF